MHELNEYLSKNENADAVIMTSIEIKNDKTTRQLGFYIQNFEYLQPINECLQSDELNLNLQELSIPINQTKIKLFNQKNIKVSRKQILPFIDKFVNNL